MLNLLRKVRNLLPRSLHFREERWYDFALDLWHQNWSSFLGACERGHEVLLMIPVVFRVVRWDHSSLLIIMEHWLGRMENVHFNDQYHVDNMKHVKEIHTCRQLLKRMIEDEYNVFEEHYKKWGKPRYLLRRPAGDGHTLESKYVKDYTEEDKKQMYKEYKSCINHEAYLKKQDMKYLCRMFEKHLEKWWV